MYGFSVDRFTINPPNSTEGITENGVTFAAVTILLNKLLIKYPILVPTCMVSA